MSKTITSDELEIMLNGHNPPRVIDVRRKSDYESDQSMIPGAVWLNPEKVEEWSKELGDEDVVIYCVRGGSVSKSTLEKLHGQNINYSLTINIYNCISDFS
jgi:rhodanese-related sulfurtransferase